MLPLGETESQQQNDACLGSWTLQAPWRPLGVILRKSLYTVSSQVCFLCPHSPVHGLSSDIGPLEY